MKEATRSTQEQQAQTQAAVAAVTQQQGQAKAQQQQTQFLQVTTRGPGVSKVSLDPPIDVDFRVYTKQLKPFDDKSHSSESFSLIG